MQRRLQCRNQCRLRSWLLGLSVDGSAEGLAVSSIFDGARLWFLVDSDEGSIVGSIVGSNVGAREGLSVGNTLGTRVGSTVGIAVRGTGGTDVGIAEGTHGGMGVCRHVAQRTVN